MFRIVLLFFIFYKVNAQFFWPTPWGGHPWAEDGFNDPDDLDPRSWGGCSVTCGRGTQMKICKPNRRCRPKTRPCYAGKCDAMPPCGMLPCSSGPPTCYKVGVAQWGECKVERRSCTQYGKESCLCGTCPPKRYKTVSRLCPCPTTSKWSVWSPCSATCGVGVSTRKRTCSGAPPKCNNGVEIEEKMCEIKQCPVWSEWNKGKCSKSCGRGTSTWTRTCGYQSGRKWKKVSPNECQGVAHQNVLCNPNDCPFEFGEWSACSVICGKGTQTRNRPCVNGAPNCVNGAETQTRECSAPDPCPEWTEFVYSRCSTSCGSGTQTATRKCVLNYGRKQKTVNPTLCAPGESSVVSNCNVFNCPDWGDYGPDSACSVTCGPGTMTKTRQCFEHSSGLPKPTSNSECSGGKKEATKEMPCNNGLCPGKWEDWSVCSVTCGVGSQYRERLCPLCLNGKETETKPCSAPTSCPAYSDWKKGSCSQSCGYGYIQATRYCSVTRGNKVERVDNSLCPIDTTTRTETCNAFNCPGWVNDGPPSTCSATCGDGSVTQERKCVEHSTGSPKDTKMSECPGGKGAKTLLTKCNLGACPGRWLVWSQCSVTCGLPTIKGVQSRTRECEQCQGGIETQTRECSPAVTCPEISEWKEGKCSKNCASGTSTETRFCFVKRGNQVEEVDISLCGNLPTEKEKSCNDFKCPEWGDWGEYGECSVSCGEGYETRTRTCYEFSTGSQAPTKDNDCDGSPEDKKPCVKEKCIITETACSLTCGGGTKYVLDEGVKCSKTNLHECKGRFAACNIHDCTDTVTCNPPMQKRYEIESCCLPETEIVEYLDDKKKLQSTQCGSFRYRSKRDLRIINGTVVRSEKMFSMMAAFVHLGVCAATIVTPRFAITAGHCVVSVDGRKSPDPYDKAYLKAGITKYDDAFDATKGYKALIKHIYVYPGFHFPKYDLAVLEVEVPFSSKVVPACMPKGERPAVDHKCWALGWGLTDPDVMEVSDKLMKVGLRVLDQNVCIQRWGNLTKVSSYVGDAKYNGYWLCAGSMSKHIDTCKGDSGGPLLCQRCDTCSLYLAGVTSFGPRKCGTPGSPGVYTSLSEPAVAKWIQTITKMSEPKDTRSCGNAAASRSFNNIKSSLVLSQNPQSEPPNPPKQNANELSRSLTPAHDEPRQNSAGGHPNTRYPYVPHYCRMYPFSRHCPWNLGK